MADAFQSRVLLDLPETNYHINTELEEAKEENQAIWQHFSAVDFHHNSLKGASGTTVDGQNPLFTGWDG